MSERIFALLKFYINNIDKDEEKGTMSKMANINTKFKKILSDLEEKIKNEQDLEYIKVQMFNLYNILFEEVNKIEELANEKIAAILEIQVQMEEKVNKIEKELKEIQKDIYEEEESDFAILCPYCNNEFVMELDELRTEVECPECNNVIELDWGHEEECGHEGCGGCHGGCHHEEDDM